MSVDDVPRVSRRKRSRKKRRSRQVRRYTKAFGWNLLALVTTAIFIIGAIYLVLSMRGAGTGVPVSNHLAPPGQ